MTKAKATLIFIVFSFLVGVLSSIYERHIGAPQFSILGVFWIGYSLGYIVNAILESVIDK